MTYFKEVLKEVVLAVLPITLLIFILHLFFLPMQRELLFPFAAGIVLVVLGLAFFLVGAKMGFLPMGEAIGAVLPEKASVALIVFYSFVLGFVATIAEPDVQVLALLIDQVSEGFIPKNILIFSIALGVGIFVALAIFRLFLGISLNYLLLAGYGLVLVLSYFTPADFLPIAFDSGGVTTGPMTVPFILALGVGVTSALGGKNTLTDGFGFVALASVGPMVAVMILGVIFY